ncbi:hypothetical protein F7734_47805 [Scytonema sp. UIC 10036]|uniref:hypothetical protein n=1 Tax=Scytonema sp. UIC 10036 TaxID=2304196 RepID=UPI0012DAC2EC|nr:hypothetical protein [Scytonema sp. UIC 10036]MUG99584.1 hypothetical protein [Scytonema sp. UIC 10036]
MAHSKWFFHKLFNTRLLTTGILTVVLLLTQVIQTEYRPPGNQKPPRTNTDSSGTRFSDQFPNLLIYTSTPSIL